jgi:hypothetical protein
VVIAIIGILAATLFPVLNRARDLWSLPWGSEFEVNSAAQNISFQVWTN